MVGVWFIFLHHIREVSKYLKRLIFLFDPEGFKALKQELKTEKKMSQTLLKQIKTHHVDVYTLFGCVPDAYLAALKPTQTQFAPGVEKAP